MTRLPSTSISPGWTRERALSRSRDFWLASGHHLLDRDAAGRLVVTDEFLKAYLARPELVPPPEACPAERKLMRCCAIPGNRSRPPGSPRSLTPMRAKTGR
jgi:hypothetical protein